MFTGNQTRHWISCIENFVSAQGIEQDEGKLKVAVSYLDAATQGHWADHCRANPGMRFDDLKSFLVKFYEKGGGAIEARRRWRAVRQGRLPVTEYLREFMAALANVMSIDDGPVSEGEKVCNFYAGLRLSMQSKCAYDPKSGRPFNDSESLVAAAKALDDTSNPFKLCKTRRNS